jgi:hypothetical protein
LFLISVSLLFWGEPEKFWSAPPPCNALGDEQLGDNQNEALNENWKEIFEVVKKI